MPTGSESGPGLTVHGIETSTFVEILRAILKAKLTETQKFLAERAQEMLIALANTTLDSILYQESGFWKAIEGQRVSEILDKYLQDHARKWAKTFPDEFWSKLDAWHRAAVGDVALCGAPYGESRASKDVPSGEDSPEDFNPLKLIHYPRFGNSIQTFVWQVHNPQEKLRHRECRRDRVQGMTAGETAFT